jgi:hypothetical protein
MSLLWLAALIVAFIVAMSVIGSRRRRGDAKLESVSERWLAEQRATDRHYSER